jgi:hypothetical protein
MLSLSMSPKKALKVSGTIKWKLQSAYEIWYLFISNIWAIFDTTDIKWMKKN